MIAIDKILADVLPKGERVIIFSVGFLLVSVSEFRPDSSSEAMDRVRVTYTLQVHLFILYYEGCLTSWRTS